MWKLQYLITTLSVLFKPFILLLYLLLYSFNFLYSGTFRPISKEGTQVLAQSITELGGIFHHVPLLVRRVLPSDKAPKGALYIVIDGNHRYYLFTHIYPYHFLKQIPKHKTNNSCMHLSLKELLFDLFPPMITQTYLRVFANH